MSIKYNAMSEMATLNEHIRLLEKRKRNKGGLTEDQKEVYKVDLEELIRLERIDRAEDDVLFFMYEYFSDMKNPENEQNLIPAGVSINEAPKFHAELCKILDEVSGVNLTARIGWAAPRGHAKSAYLSNAFPIHQICFQKRKGKWGQALLCGVSQKESNKVKPDPIYVIIPNSSYKIINGNFQYL